MVPKRDVPGTNIMDSNILGLSVGTSFAGDDPGTITLSSTSKMRNE